MKSADLLAGVMIAVLVYGTYALIRDISRGTCAVFKGIRDACLAVGGGIARHWRSWIADRERRRRQDRDQMVAFQITTISQLTSLLEEMQRKCTAMEADRDEAKAKPAAAPAATRHGN